MAAEAHVVHRGDPEPHGVGGDHAGVKSDIKIELSGPKDVYSRVSLASKCLYEPNQTRRVNVTHRSAVARSANR